MDRHSAEQLGRSIGGTGQQRGRHGGRGGHRGHQGRGGYRGHGGRQDRGGRGGYRGHRGHQGRGGYRGRGGRGGHRGFSGRPGSGSRVGARVPARTGASVGSSIIPSAPRQKRQSVDPRFKGLDVKDFVKIIGKSWLKGFSSIMKPDKFIIRCPFGESMRPVLLRAKMGAESLVVTPSDFDAETALSLCRQAGVQCAMFDPSSRTQSPTLIVSLPRLAKALDDYIYNINMQLPIDSITSKRILFCELSWTQVNLLLTRIKRASTPLINTRADTAGRLAVKWGFISSMSVNPKGLAPGHAGGDKLVQAGYRPDHPRMTDVVALDPVKEIVEIVAKEMERRGGKEGGQILIIASSNREGGSIKRGLSDAGIESWVSPHDSGVKLPTHVRRDVLIATEFLPDFNLFKPFSGAELVITVSKMRTTVETSLMAETEALVHVPEYILTHRAGLAKRCIVVRDESDPGKFVQGIAWAGAGNVPVTGVRGHELISERNENSFGADTPTAVQVLSVLCMRGDPVKHLGISESRYVEIQAMLLKLNLISVSVKQTVRDLPELSRFETFSAPFASINPEREIANKSFLSVYPHIETLPLARLYLDTGMSLAASNIIKRAMDIFEPRNNHVYYVFRSLVFFACLVDKSSDHILRMDSRGNLQGNSRSRDPIGSSDTTTWPTIYDTDVMTCIALYWSNLDFRARNPVPGADETWRKSNPVHWDWGDIMNETDRVLDVLSGFGPELGRVLSNRIDFKPHIGSITKSIMRVLWDTALGRAERIGGSGSMLYVDKVTGKRYVIDKFASYDKDVYKHRGWPDEIRFFRAKPVNQRTFISLVVTDPEREDAVEETVEDDFRGDPGEYLGEYPGEYLEEDFRGPTGELGVLSEAPGVFEDPSQQPSQVQQPPQQPSSQQPSQQEPSQTITFDSVEVDFDE